MRLGVVGGMEIGSMGTTELILVHTHTPASQARSTSEGLSDGGSPVSLFLPLLVNIRKSLIKKSQCLFCIRERRKIVFHFCWTTASSNYIVPVWSVFSFIMFLFFWIKLWQLLCICVLSLLCILEKKKNYTPWFQVGIPVQRILTGTPDPLSERGRMQEAAPLK